MRTVISTPFVAALLVSFSIAATPLQAADVLSSGIFTGASNHVTSGGVSVVESGDERAVVLGADFSFDGAPDPKVGFGKDGKYDIRSQLDALRANNGEQTYVIPADLEIDEYNEIYIWCEAYSVPLGVAALK